MAVRLIHLAHYGGAHTGSFVPMLRRVMDRAAERGWQGELVFSKDAEGRAWLKELEGDGYAVSIAPPAGRRKLARWLEDHLDDVDGEVLLHTHFTMFDIPAVLVAGRRPGTTVVWHIHSRPVSNPLIRVRNEIKYRVFGRQVTAALCVAPNVATQVAGRGMSEEKVELFPNAIDTDRFSPPKHEQREWARSILGLPEDGQVLLHFGRDWHGKGGDRLVDAVRLLRQNGNESITALTISGETESDGGLRSLDGTPGVYVAGPMEEVALLYSAADLFISSSRGEGQPYSVLEALSSGVPVLASPLPGHEMVAELVPSCRVVDMDDPNALADGITSVLGQKPEARRSMIDAGCKAVAANFGLAAWASHLFELYGTFVG